MTYTEIQIALEKHMAAWPGAVPIWFDGTIIPPDVRDARCNDPRAPWVRFVIITSKAFTAGIGASPCRRVPGVITAEIYCPADLKSPDTGFNMNPTRECLRIADSLAEHFEYWQSGKISTLATSSIPVEVEKTKYGDWYRRNVVTDFDAD